MRKAGAERERLITALIRLKTWSSNRAIIEQLQDENFAYYIPTVKELGKIRAAVVVCRYSPITL